MASEHKATLKEKAVEELRDFWVLFVYLAFMLSGLLTYRRLVLHEVGVSYLHYGMAVIEALIIAKVILIGQALGLTYVHVCRTLQVLHEQEVLHLANHTLEVIDPAALMTAAGVEPDVLSHQRQDGRRSAVSYPSNWEPTCSLPAGWMPVQNDRAVSLGFASALSGHAFTAAQAA